MLAHAPLGVVQHARRWVAAAVQRHHRAAQPVGGEVAGGAVDPLGAALARLSLRQDTDDPAAIALLEISNTYQFGKNERLE
jgi:hypothetical protein